MTETFYKFTGPHGVAAHGGTGSWFLPRGNQPGKWMPPIQGALVVCKNGYHLCRRADVLNWLSEEID